MDDTLSKLRPDRDLQCYFFEPSAIAALSETGPDGFTVSGCWRSQFDWAVLEWNRDNVFEYPSLRNLPDGDLSGLQLSYQEARTNCIGLDSTWYPTEPWPYLRIWAEIGGAEQIYEVPLLQYATPLSTAVPATAQFQLSGAPTSGDYVELAWLDQHYNYQLVSGDTLSSAATALAGIITANQQTGRVSATADGSTITLTYLGVSGSNGNRIGVYGTVHGAGTESWTPPSALFQNGVSPTAWQVNLDFANLTDMNGVSIPTANVTNVRKLRWTWAADMQTADFQRSEFSVVVSNWTVHRERRTISSRRPRQQADRRRFHDAHLHRHLALRDRKLLGGVHTLNDSPWLRCRVLLYFAVCPHLVPRHAGAGGRWTGNCTSGRRHADRNRPGACWRRRSDASVAGAANFIR